MLDLTFDLVLGTPWLAKVNPRMDWVKRTMMVQVKGRWMSLPTLAHGRLCVAMSRGLGKAKVAQGAKGDRLAAEQNDGVSV